MILSASPWQNFQEDNKIMSFYKHLNINDLICKTNLL